MNFSKTTRLSVSVEDQEHLLSRTIASLMQHLVNLEHLDRLHSLEHVRPLINEIRGDIHCLRVWRDDLKNSRANEQGDDDHD